MSTSSSNPNTALSDSFHSATTCLMTLAGHPLVTRCLWHPQATHQQTRVLLPPVWEAAAPLTPLLGSGSSHLSPLSTLALLPHPQPRHSATSALRGSPQSEPEPHPLLPRPFACPALCRATESSSSVQPRTPSTSGPCYTSSLYTTHSTLAPALTTHLAAGSFWQALCCPLPLCFYSLVPLPVVIIDASLPNPQFSTLAQ